MSRGLICLSLLSLQVFVLVSGEENTKENLCRAQETCSSCVQATDCVWCSVEPDSKSKSPFTPCVSRATKVSLQEEWCPRSKAVDLWSTTDPIENKPLSTVKGKDPIQVQPQRLKIRLKKGETQRVKLSYREAEDYPVDLYYLMDLSKSMKKHRDNLVKLGSELSSAMRNLTSNFRIGFGSFVDKVVMPMTSTMPSKLVSPCNLGDEKSDDKGPPCAPPYEYINQMSLTENTSLFVESVQKAPISGNIDTPEGGLDAMMQVMVCTKEIGWREKARHLIVFSTDADFHIAGDGRLAGIIEPNDCGCHLDEDGLYSQQYSLGQDYPSISQIKRKADEHNMNIIFAVTGDMLPTYEKLSARINGSAVGQLDGTSKSVVDLVSNQYQELKTSVELHDNAPDFIEVKYYSRCANESAELKERRVCKGRIKPDDIMVFEIDIKATECPTDGNYNRTLQIKPQGVSESLTIDLELLCECDCEKSGNKDYIHNAEKCHHRGDLKCGVCSCGENSYGKHCECQVNEAVAAGSDASDSCKPANETLVCSGHGTCKCGVCQCSKRSDSSEWYWGKYCQCDNFSCQRYKGLVCGGSSRGTCECGTCNCKTDWGGKDCGCKNTNTTCTPPGDNSKICSDRGKCVCGTCECEERDGIQYSGQYCQECSKCPGHLCTELKDCVECLAYRLGPLVANDCANCTFPVIAADEIVPNPDEDKKTDTKVCTVYGDAGCSFVFKYRSFRYRGDNPSMTGLEVTYKKERECPHTVNVLGVAGGLIAGTVIIGFVSLLIWKLLTMAHDQREFAKFEKERAIAKWDRGDNPLYKKATSQFENPTFTQNEKS